MQPMKVLLLLSLDSYLVGIHRFDSWCPDKFQNWKDFNKALYNAELSNSLSSQPYKMGKILIYRE